MGGGKNPQAAMDKATALVENRKLEIQKNLDKYEEGVQENLRPMKERALEAYSNAGKSKKELGAIEVAAAKSTTGVLQNYQNQTNENYNARQQGLFTVLNTPQVDPQTASRISSRMAALQSLFEE